MKTEIETYLEIIEKDCELNKNDKFFLKINPVGDGIEKSISFYKIIEYPKCPRATDYLPFFWFKSKKLDEKAIKNIEKGLVNLAKKGYNINYYNTC